jgi:hypothetical protein
LKQRGIYLKLRPVAGTTTLAVVAVLAIAPVTDAAVRVEVDRLVVQVSAARHIPFRGKLQARAITRDAADAQIAAALATRITTVDLAAEEQMLKRLGLIAGDADYAKLWAAGASSAAVATYDPATQRLLVPDFLPLESQRVALIHEIAHAVADQRFDLRGFLAPPPQALDRVRERAVPPRELGAGGVGPSQGPLSTTLSGDAARARLALVEGDATLTTMEVVDPSGAFLRPTALASLADRLRTAASEGRAAWLAALTRFVHVDGMLFVARVRARQPWSAVDLLWRDPPVSSEQILHPEKYESCESPVPVPESALPALAGFEPPRASDVLGELVIRAWLATALPPDVAARAAAGWGGDRAALYRPVPAAPDAGAPAPLTSGLPALAWLTVWDDAGEADDFARAAAAVAGDASVQRRDEAVALWFGPADPAPEALVGMLDGWRAVTAKARTHGSHKARAAGERPSGGGARASGGCPRGLH